MYPDGEKINEYIYIDIERSRLVIVNSGIIFERRDVIESTLINGDEQCTCLEFYTDSYAYMYIN